MPKVASKMILAVNNDLITRLILLLVLKFICFLSFFFRVKLIQVNIQKSIGVIGFTSIKSKIILGKQIDCLTNGQVVAIIYWLKKTRSKKSFHMNYGRFF